MKEKPLRRAGAACVAFATVAMLLAGCAAPPKKTVAAAATTPLGDLNLLRSEVPGILLDALKQPYAVPRELSCSALITEVRALDDVLGPDLDAKPGPDPTITEKGLAEAETSLLDAIRRTAEGLIPYRSWVRKISGAEHYEKFLATTVAAGNARRAFLKGIKSTRHCGN